MNNEMKTVLVMGIGVLVVLVIIGLLASMSIVNPGERGILTTWGQVEQYSLNEGLHWKVPIMQGVYNMDVKTQKTVAKASAASKDLQVVTTTVALNFRVSPNSAHALFQEIGTTYADKVINPAIQESVKAATARFTAEQLITQRPLVKAEIENALKERLAPLYLEVQNMSITNFDFSDQFNAAIEAKVTAEQQAFKAKEDLVRIKIEAEQRVTQAKAESDAKKLQAEAEAYDVEVKGKATAEALKLQREQINTLLNDFKAIEKWNGELPVFTGGGAIPFLNIDSLAKEEGS